MRLFTLFTAALIASIPACDQAGLDTPTTTALAATASGALTSDNVSSLVRLREEEKLARDVYRTLGDRWELTLFDNITLSEQRHMDRVGELLVAYGIEDPVVDDSTGAFTSTEMQALYAALVSQGSESVGAALGVGAAIEELDIFDLEEALADEVPADVARVYENLMKGSRNHLRAFARQLAANDVPYTPTSLTAEEVEAIVSTPAERGPANGGGMGQGGGQGQGGGFGGQGQGQGRGFGGLGDGSCDQPTAM
jgi:hypothetical protein